MLFVFFSIFFFFVCVYVLSSFFIYRLFRNDSVFFFSFFFFFVVVYLFVVFLFPASTSPFRITVRGDALVQAGKGAARDSRCGIVELSTTHALFPSFFFLSLRNAEALSSEPTVERKKSILGKLPFFFFFSPVCVRVGFRAYTYIYIYSYCSACSGPIVFTSFLSSTTSLFFFFFCGQSFVFFAAT